MYENASIVVIIVPIEMYADKCIQLFSNYGNLSLGNLYQQDVIPP